MTAPMTTPTTARRAARPSLPGSTTGRPDRRAGPAALDLLALARRGLLEAGLTTAPTERYALAHLAALRAAAAVLAARVQPPQGSRGRRPTSAWALLTLVTPELGEWAAFFAAGAAKRAAAEAGISRAVSAREADDLLRDAETFLAVIETTLGFAHQAVLRPTGSG